MSRRIRKSDLTAVVARINQLAGTPAEPYRRDESGQWVANVGNYHLSGAYGGHALHRMSNTGGGISDVLHSGHVPARQLYDMLHAYVRGMESARQSV